MEPSPVIARRQLLQASAVGAAGVLAASHIIGTPRTAAAAGASALLQEDHKLMLDKITVAAFAACVGSTFRVHPASGGAVDLKLVEATGHGNRYGWKPESGVREPFSLLFVGPKEPCMPQATYRMEHERWGQFEMFIVPIGPAKDGMQYEAIFN